MTSGTAGTKLYIDTDIKYFYNSDNQISNKVPHKFHLMLVDQKGLGQGTNAQLLRVYSYVDIRFYESNGQLAVERATIPYYNDDSKSGFTSVTNISMDQWTNIRFVLDVETATYDMLIDGETVLSSIPFLSNGAINGTTVTKENFQSLVAAAAANSSDTSAPYMAIDNTYIFKATGGSTVGNYDKLLNEVNTARMKIAAGVINGTIDSNTADAFYATLTAIEDTVKEAQINGSMDQDSCDAYSSAVQEIIGSIGSGGVSKGGVLYSNTFDSKGSLSELFLLGNYSQEYSNSSERIRYIFANDNTAIASAITDGLKMHYSSNSSTPQYQAGYDFKSEGPNATLVMELDIMFENLRSTGSSYTFSIIDSKHADFGSGNYVDFVKLVLDGTTGLFSYIYNSNTTVCTHKPVQDGEWYRLRFEVYGGSTESGTPNGKQSVWINGEKIVDNKYTSSTSFSKISSLDQLKITKMANTTFPYSYGPKMCIDNVFAYKSNINAPVYPNNGSLVAYIREIEKLAATTTMYSSSTIAALNNELNIAKAACTDVDATDSTLKNAEDRLRAFVSNLVADNPISLTVEGYSYESGYEMTPGGKINGLYITKNSDVNVPESLIVASYNDSSLVDVYNVSIPSTMKNGTTEVVPVEIELPTENLDSIKIKAFVWNSVYGMTPLALPNYTLTKTDKTDVTIHLVGDSTVADYSLTYYPQAGWGQMFGNYFRNDIKIVNHAKPGESSKSFLDNGLWDTVLSMLKEGDYVFIQLCTNDQKADAYHSDAKTSYKNNLKRYIDDTRRKGATPILLTPPARGLTDNNKPVAIPNHGSYATAIAEVAQQYGVMLIDLLGAHYQMILDGIANAEGANESARVKAYMRDAFLVIDADDSRYVDDPLFFDSSYNTGKSIDDRTHFCEYGADLLAGAVADALKAANHPLKAYMVEHTPVKK